MVLLGINATYPFLMTILFRYASIFYLPSVYMFYIHIFHVPSHPPYFHFHKYIHDVHGIHFKYIPDVSSKQPPNQRSNLPPPAL